MSEQTEMATTEQHSFRLADLVADAIVAAHVRLTADGESDAVQFLYLFLDYIRLALPDARHLAISIAGERAGLSTERGKPGEMIASDFARVKHDLDDVIDIYQKLDSSDDQFNALQDLIGRICHVASNRVGSSSPLGCTLAAGLTVLRGDDRPDATSPEMNAPDGDCSEESVSRAKAIVSDIHNALAGTLILAAAGYTFVFRHRIDSEWIYKTLRFIVKGSEEGAQLVSQPTEETVGADFSAAQSALDSGFVQVVLSSQEGRLMAIPCHFGGVPWIAVIQTIPTTDGDRWCAYMTYRDVVPVLNDSIRRAAWGSLFRQMRALFFEAVSGAHADELKARVDHGWSPLQRVYPVAPELIEVDELQTDRSTILPAAGRWWRAQFSPDGNRLFHSPLQATQGATGQWEKISNARLERGFSVPVRARLDSEQARIDIEMAENVYAIGHPLKHRLEPIGGDLGTLANRIKESDTAAALAEVNRCKSRVEAAKRTAKCLDMMAELCRASGRPESMDREKGFFDHKPYPLGDRIERLTQEASASLSIHIDPQLIRHHARIECTIPTKPTPSRLFDTFFDDLVYELCINAVHRTPPSARLLRISIERIQIKSGTTANALSFANPMSPIQDPEGRFLFPADGQYHRWVTTAQGQKKGPKGGLRFMAVALRQSRTGDVYARITRSAEQWEFGIAIVLPLRMDGHH